LTFKNLGLGRIQSHALCDCVRSCIDCTCPRKLSSLEWLDYGTAIAICYCCGAAMQTSVPESNILNAVITAINAFLIPVYRIV